jgi:hypothetical protein|nr:MAG TPA: SlyX-like protein [Caudoviricetes sp.]
MQETILINGMSRPISNTNENLIPPVVETREVTREYRDISKEVFSTIYEEKLQTSKTLEDFEKRIQRMEVAVNHMESDINRLNGVIADMQQLVQRGRIIL